MKKYLSRVLDYFVGKSQLWAGLVPCALGSGSNGVKPCSWNELYTLANNVISFMIFKLGVPLATIAIVVAGIEMVLHRDQSTARTVWKERIQKAILGLVIMMVAYLLVKVVVYGLTNGGDIYNLRSRVKQ